MNVIYLDTGEARTNACSILWSFAARDEKSDAGKVREASCCTV